MRGAVVGFGLAGKSGGYYLPLGHAYLGAPAQLDVVTVGKVLGPLLADASVAKASHDAKHLRVALDRLGLGLDGIRFDTMLASYVLDPEIPHTLGEIAARELAIGVSESATLIPKVRGREPIFDDARIEDATIVVAARAAAIHLLWERLLGKLSEEALNEVLERIELPLTDDPRGNGALRRADRRGAASRPRDPGGKGARGSRTAGARRSRAASST